MNEAFMTCIKYGEVRAPPMDRTVATRVELPIHFFFWPLMTQVSPPLGVFQVVSARLPVPDPPAGSVRPKQPTFFAKRAMGGSHFCFRCASKTKKKKKKKRNPPK